jgi:hypothetical protein
LHVLVTLSDFQRWVALGIAWLFLLLLLLTLGRAVRSRRLFQEADAFLLLAVLATVLYALSPQGLAGGSLLKPRLSLYPYFLLIPWFSPGLGPKARKAATAALALGALAYLGSMTWLYRVRGAETECFLAALEPIRPNTRVMPLLFSRNRRTDSLSHAIDYKALEKGLIDWDNYEAKTSYFSTRFRSSVVLPTLPVLAPATTPVQRNRRHVDAVYTWRMPPGSILRKRLKRQYDLVSARYGGELYEVRQGGPGVESPHARRAPGGGPGPDRPDPGRERRRHPRPAGRPVGGM